MWPAGARRWRGGGLEQATDLLAVSVHPQGCVRTPVDTPQQAPGAIQVHNCVCCVLCGLGGITVDGQYSIAASIP